MKLDKNKTYNLEELTSDERIKLLEQNGFKDFFYSDVIAYDDNVGWFFSKEHVVTHNAKELFYTLENIQIDCTNETEERIKEMCKVYESSGFKKWTDPDALIKTDFYNYLRIDHENEFYITGESDNFTTKKKEKFMELFGKEEKEDNRIVEEIFPNIKIIERPTLNVNKPKHYTKGIDTFARMEANCTTEECLAFAKGNIDKYNFRTKGQDLEDYEKIVSYANWAISLLNKA